MNANTRIIEIKALLFESNDPEVLVKGTIQKGHMNFETDVIISQSQLNSLINQLQKQNHGREVYEFLSSKKMYNGEIMYTAELSDLENRMVNLADIFPIESIRQIRA